MSRGRRYGDTPVTGSPERIALRREICEKVDKLGISYREIVNQYDQIGNASMVCRLIQEHRKANMTVEVRDQEIANLTVWQTRLEEYAERIMAAGDIEHGQALGGLAVAAVKVSKSLREILGVDKVITARVQVSGTGDVPFAAPWIGEALDKWQSSPLYARDAHAAGMTVAQARTRDDAEMNGTS